MPSRHLRGTAPGHDVRDRGYTANTGTEGPADQRGGAGGDQGCEKRNGGETGAPVERSDLLQLGLLPVSEES